jgi:hypothetical protein
MFMKPACQAGREQRGGRQERAKAIIQQLHEKRRRPFLPGGKARNETAGRSAGATKTSRAQAHARPCCEQSVNDAMRNADSQ